MTENTGSGWIQLMFADSISLTRGDVLTPGSGLLIDHRMQVGWVGADGGGGV